MARPKKHNADYFSHDNDMRNDPRIKALRRKFSHVGYAVWNYILETLADADFFEINWSDIDIEILSGDYDVTPDELREVVNYCVKLELLTFEQSETGVKLVCKKLVERFSDLITKRVKNAKNRVSAAETPENLETEEFQQQKPQKEVVSAAQNPQSKVKYSKVNISKDIVSSLSHSPAGENLKIDENSEKSENPINPESASPPPPGSGAPPVADTPPGSGTSSSLIALDELNATYRRKGFPQQELVIRAVPTHCRSHDDVWMWLDRFTIELTVKGETHKTWLDFQNHFINWLKQQPPTHQANGKQSITTHKTDSRRGDMSGSKQRFASDILAAQQEFERGLAANGESHQGSKTAPTIIR